MIPETPKMQCKLISIIVRTENRGFMDLDKNFVKKKVLGSGEREKSFAVVRIRKSHVFSEWRSKPCALLYIYLLHVLQALIQSCFP